VTTLAVLSELVQGPSELCAECQEALDREKAAAMARGAREERQRRMASRRAGAGIPANLQNLAFRDLATWPGDIVLIAHQWSIAGGGLFLHGPNGTGKTTLAAAAAWALLERADVQWVKAASLAYWVQADFKSDEYRRAMALAGSAGALVLDDLGQEMHNATAAAVIRDTIEARIDAGAPLLITSNNLISELAARPFYGPWLGSRLAGYCRQFELAGRDHRLDHLPGAPS
jgi:DNA replication protein DnaC